MNRILLNRFVTSQSAAFGGERLSASADEAAHIERVARSLSRCHYRLHAEDLCLTQVHTQTRATSACSSNRGVRNLEASQAHGIRIDGGKCEPFRQVHQTHVRLSSVSSSNYKVFKAATVADERPARHLGFTTDYLFVCRFSLSSHPHPFAARFL